MTADEPITNMSVRNVLEGVQNQNPTFGILALPYFCNSNPLECFLIFLKKCMKQMQQMKEVFRSEQPFTVGGDEHFFIVKTSINTLLTYSSITKSQER